MQFFKIEIKGDYTSEDGWIYWVRVQKRRGSRWVSVDGHENINDAFKTAKRYLGFRSVRLR